MKRFDVNEQEASLLLEDLGRIAEPAFREFEEIRDAPQVSP